MQEMDVDRQTLKLDTTYLRVVTVDESNVAASALICDAFDWKCYNHACPDSNLKEELLKKIRKYD